MNLTHLRITGLGPFRFTQEIEIDPRVTILTGSNDTGKSSTLRFLQMFLQNKSAEEMDVNQDYLQGSQTRWTDDNQVRVEIQLQLNRNDVEPIHWLQNFNPKDFTRISKAMTVKLSGYDFRACH